MSSDIKQRLRGFVKEYDTAYPMRLADMHRVECICLRCQRDLNEATADRIEAREAEVKTLKGDVSVARLVEAAANKQIKALESEVAALKEALDRAGNPQLPAPASAYVEMRDRAERLEGEVAELQNWKQDFEPDLAKAEARAERLRVALDKARKFIADQFATDEDKDNGEWLAKDAREIYATLCETLEDNKQ